MNDHNTMNRQAWLQEEQHGPSLFKDVIDVAEAFALAFIFLLFIGFIAIWVS